MNGRSVSGKSPLKSVALWVVVGVLFASAAGFGFALSALKITLQKLKIEAPHGIKTSEVATSTASWVRARDKKGMEVPDRRESAEIEKTLGTTNYVSRTYVQRNPGDRGQPIALDLHLAYYTGMIDTVPHVPDRCFVGGGLQIGEVLGDVPLKMDGSRWRASKDVPPELGSYVEAFVPGEPPFGGDYVRLCRKPEEIRLRTMKFLGGGDLYAGYFFIANGGHTPSPDGVRALAFDMTSTYAYYLKVQVTSSSCRNSEEFVAAASSLIGELMGDIMRTTPDWVSVLRGKYPVVQGSTTKAASELPWRGGSSPGTLVMEQRDRK
jgi:hypothetical protein